MFYSLIKLRGAAEQQEFSFPFPYIKREDIAVTVGGAKVPFTFTSSNTISLREPLPVASDVVIRRTTERSVLLVDYSQTAELSEDDLDLAARQFLYIAQEALDMSQEAVVLDENGWDARNNRIRNVKAPEAPEDAVNKAYLEDALAENEGVLVSTAERAERAAENAHRGASLAQTAAKESLAHKESAEDVLQATNQVLVDALGVLNSTEEAKDNAWEAVVSAEEQADRARYWYDVFRSIYYGVRQDHPTGDVTPGAMYYSSSLGRLFFYNGTQWYSPTSDAERAEAARRFVESMRNEVSNMRDQVQVYSGQAQELVGEAQDAANAAARHEGAARNEAAVAQNQAIASASAATLAGERATAADASAKVADAAAGRAEAAAEQVGETFGDRGSWYVAHGMPTKPMRSALWTVMDGGELDGVEWNVGDMLVYSIKTNSFGRITGASITPSEPGPIEAEEGVILGEGKFIRARVGANIRWLAHANSEGVKLGDNAVELHLLGNNMVFGALKHPVFHKGNLPSWDDVTGKPESFPVGAHAHKWDEITGKPAAALRWPTWFEVSDKPTYFPPVNHGHSWNEITNKPDTAVRWPTAAEAGAAPAGYGLGTEGASLADKSCNDAMESGFYSIYSSTTDTPYGSGPSGSGMMVVRWGGGAGCFQLFFAYTAARVHARRRYQDQWLDWFELYSTSKKPTAADVGALPATGGNLTGKVQFVGVADAGGLGRYALDLNNHNVGGLNALVFNDPAEAGGEGIFFPKTGKNDGSTSMADYDVITALDGTLLFNGKKVYHADDKPTLEGLGAAPDGYGLGTYGTNVTDANACGSGSGFYAGGGDNAANYYDKYAPLVQVSRSGGADGTGFLGQIQLSNGKIAVRTRASNVWSQWNVLYGNANKPTAADVKARPDTWVPSWGDVTGKPETFPAATHGHAWGDITGKPSTFPATAHKHSWAELTGVPVYATRWPTAAEAGAAPSGYGLGTYAASVPSNSVNTGLRNASGFYNASALADRPRWPMADVHTWDYFINIAHSNSAGYNGVIAMDFNGRGLAYKAINGGNDKGWQYVYSTSYKPTPAEIGAAALNHGHARQFGSEQSLSTEDLDTIKTPGVYAQHANVNTSAARHYPENLAGSLTVTVGAGVQQRYHVYNTSRIWTRAQYDKGAWTPWAREYNTLNKPSAAEIGALPAQAPGGVLEIGKYIDFHDPGTNVDYSLRLHTEGTSLRIQGSNGYVDVGAKNTGYAHYYTDRPTHYFDKNVSVNDLQVRSDARLKSNLEPLTDALAKVRSLAGWTYDKKLTLDSEGVYRRETGLIAQDVQKVLPTAVHVVAEEGDLLTLSSSALIALLVEAVKELSAKVEALEHGRT